MHPLEKAFLGIQESFFVNGRLIAVFEFTVVIGTAARFAVW